MKVRDLKTHLDTTVNKAKVNQMLTTISHWTKIVNESPKGEYSADTLHDVETLEQLSGLGIVSLRKGSGTVVIAQLTQDGKELYRDFMGLGYYL